MKTKIFKTIVSLLLLAGSFSSCEKKDNINMSNIDFSNIENLHAQPLPVIQKCVEGKWKCTSHTWGFLGQLYPANTLINIANDSITVTGDNNFSKKFSYSWIKKEVQLNNNAAITYIMWSDEQSGFEWFFDKIQNDTLWVVDNKAGWEGTPNSTYYWFLRAK